MHPGIIKDEETKRLFRPKLNIEKKSDESPGTKTNQGN